MTASDAKVNTMTPSAQGSVLVLADRDRRLQELARTFLEEAGHKISFAIDGAHALELVRSARPKVLIAEILLPKLDGLALCRAVKADANLKETRVLIFSILAAGTRAKEAGADGFLNKPLARERLVSALDRLINASF